MTSRDFLQSDERDLLDARVESRSKISRLVSAISNQRRAEPPPRSPEQPRRAYAFAPPAADSPRYDDEEEGTDDLPPPPDYELSLMHIRHADVEEHLPEEAPRRRAPRQEAMPSRPAPASKTSRLAAPLSAAPAKDRLSRTAAPSAAKGAPQGEGPRGAPPRPKPPSKASVSRGKDSEAKEESKGLGGESKATPLSAALAGMDLRARRAAERRAQLHAAAAERVRARQQQLEEEDRERERRLAEDHFAMLDERRQKKEAEAAEAARRQELTRAARRGAAQAERFRRSQLLVRCAWAPWVRLMEERSLNIQKADIFARDALLQRAWNSFHGYCQARRLELYRAAAKQQSMAAAHYRRMLLKSSWSKWRFLRRMERAKALAVQNQAVKFSRLRKAMVAWKTAFERKLRANAHVSRRALNIGRRCIWRYYLSQWRRFVANAAIEREIEFRTRATWSKVQSWL